MLRLLIAAAVAAPLAANAAAKTDSEHKAPKPPAVAHAAKACTLEGAFGRDFADGYGHIDSTADDDWAPFEHLTIAGHEITATASFRGAGSGDWQDAALAGKFRKAFETAVAEKGKFPEHEKHGDGVEYRSRKDPDRGLVLQIWQEDDRIIAKCIDRGD